MMAISSLASLKTLQWLQENPPVSISVMPSRNPYTLWVNLSPGLTTLLIDLRHRIALSIFRKAGKRKESSVMVRLIHHLGDDKPPFPTVKPGCCPVALLGHYLFIAFSDLEAIVPVARPGCNHLLSQVQEAGV
jgi:hypothetical protein